MVNQGQQKINVPYGMTLDQNGNLYVCMNGSGKVLKINVNTRNVDQMFQFDTMNVTNCTFGGRKRDTLICTTASVDFNGKLFVNQTQQQIMQNGRLQQCRNMQCQGQINQRWNYQQN
jgi:sugar lactone lactonase YvrE